MLTARGNCAPTSAHVVDEPSVIPNVAGEVTPDDEYSPCPYSVVVASPFVYPVPMVAVSDAIWPAMPTRNAPLPKARELVATAVPVPVPVWAVTPLVE
jgi:hypothetical protein